MATKKLTSEEAIIDLQGYIRNPKGFILLTGKNGRGKTFAAMHVYKALSRYTLPDRDWDQAWFINQADLNMICNKEYDLHRHCGDALEQAYRSNLLVIDDLGTRIPSAAFLDFLYAVVDYRYNESHNKGTIITTNLGSKEIRENFGDAVSSRVLSGQNYIITGEDRRFGNLGF